MSEDELNEPAGLVKDDQARLAALYRVSRILGTSLDLDEVLSQVMDAVIGLTGAERGILVLMEMIRRNGSCVWRATWIRRSWANGKP